MNYTHTHILYLYKYSDHVFKSSSFALTFILSFLLGPRRPPCFRSFPQFSMLSSQRKRLLRQNLLSLSTPELFREVDVPVHLMLFFTKGFRMLSLQPVSFILLLQRPTAESTPRVHFQRINLPRTASSSEVSLLSMTHSPQRIGKYTFITIPLHPLIFILMIDTHQLISQYLGAI